MRVILEHAGLFSHHVDCAYDYSLSAPNSAAKSFIHFVIIIKTGSWHHVCLIECCLILLYLAIIPASRCLCVFVSESRESCFQVFWAPFKDWWTFRPHCKFFFYNAPLSKRKQGHGPSLSKRMFNFTNKQSFGQHVMEARCPQMWKLNILCLFSKVIRQKLGQISLFFKLTGWFRLNIICTFSLSAVLIWPVVSPLRSEGLNRGEIVRIAGNNKLCKLMGL